MVIEKIGLGNNKPRGGDINPHCHQIGKISLDNLHLDMVPVFSFFDQTLLY